MKYKYLMLACCAVLFAACNKTGDSLAPVATVDKLEVTAIDTDSIPKACVDKYIDRTGNSDLATDAVLFKDNKWPNGTTLHIKFLNGDSFLQAQVMKYAKAWEPYANIKFVKVTGSTKAEIHVGFKINKDVGSWSYIGTDAKYIAQNKPSINFGWFNDKTSSGEFSRTVTHEFGHALGLVHEQSSPVEGIKWNKTAVYKYYEGPPNNWTKEEIDDNIFYKYTKAETKYTAFDAKSIMEYPVDEQFTTDHKAIGYNYNLSATDKKFIATIYPKNN